jgi:single-stranded-DNA-specific exonuclease
MMLAYTGAVKEGVIDIEELSCRLMGLLNKFYPETLKERYKVEAPVGTPGWELLEMAGIATVCDIMPLRDENRIIVKEGLKRMRLKPCMGLLALMQVNGLEPAKLNAYHLGFVIGPCMNATGRLDSAGRSLELLAATERSEAMNLASELKELNDSRKNMTAKGVEEAHAMIEKEGLKQDNVLVVYLPECHESLAGIIAGRIRETYCKPTFVLTDSEEGVKGSGRSIDAYHMYEEMVKCGECFSKFGGHKLAAGFSIDRELFQHNGNIYGLRKRLNEACTLTEDDMVRKVHIDVPMPLSFASIDLAGQMELLEPFGVGNPKPLFAQKDVTFISGKKIGANQNYAKYQVLDDCGKRQDVMFFGNMDAFHAFFVNKYGAEVLSSLYSGKGCSVAITITYQLGINSFRGVESVKMIMQDYS